MSDIPEMNMKILAALGLDSSRKITGLKIVLSPNDVPRVYVEEIRTDTTELAVLLSTYRLVPIADDSSIASIAGKAPGRVEAVRLPEPCEAVQHADSMLCKRCGLLWDTNDPSPPECPRIDLVDVSTGRVLRSDYPVGPPNVRVREPSIFEPALHFAASMVKRAKAVWARVRGKVKHDY